MRPAEHSPGTPGQPPPPAESQCPSPSPRFGGIICLHHPHSLLPFRALTFMPANRASRRRPAHKAGGRRCSEGTRGHGGPCQHLHRAGTRSAGTFSSLAHTGRESGAAPLSQRGNKAAHALLRNSRPPPAPTFPAIRRSRRGRERSPGSPGSCRGQSIARRLRGNTATPLSAIGSPLPAAVKSNTSKEVTGAGAGKRESRGGWQEAAGSSRGREPRRGGRKGQTLVSLLWERAQQRLSRRKPSSGTHTLEREQDSGVTWQR